MNDPDAVYRKVKRKCIALLNFLHVDLDCTSQSSTIYGPGITLAFVLLIQQEVIC